MKNQSFVRGWFTIMLTVLESQSLRFLLPMVRWKVVNWLIQDMPQPLRRKKKSLMQR